MNRYILIVSVICNLLVSCTSKETAAPPPLLPLPSESQMAWHQMEMNAFIHFSINTFTNKEWGYGDEKESLFNPTSLNTDQWANTLKEAGFKTIILTCKHHDGFCLWPSKFTRHSVIQSPWLKGKGDVVKMVSESCKKYGLKFGIYVSPWDRHHAEYGSTAYVIYYRNQLNELLDAYGPIFETWFDGANGGDGYYGGKRESRKINGATYYDWPGTIQMVWSRQPGMIFFSDAGPGVRWVGNERGIAGETNWNTISTDTLFAGKSGIESLLNSGTENGKQWIPAETDVSIRPGWFYHAAEDSLVKTPQQLFEIYLKSVGRGSTLLLNVPPDRRGLIADPDINSLRGFRKILDSLFRINLAAQSIVTANYRGNDPRYAPEMVTDGKPETFWATNDHELKGELEIQLKAKSRVRFIVLQEFIRLGQRVKEFSIKIMYKGQWKEAGGGTTIGYKRIIQIEPQEAEKIKIVIKDSKACPLISNIELY